MGRPERGGAAEPGPEGEQRGGSGCAWIRGRVRVCARGCVRVCGAAPSRAALGTAAGVAVSGRVPPRRPRDRPERSRPFPAGRWAPRGAALGDAGGRCGCERGAEPRCARSLQPDPSPRLCAERLFLAALRP